MSETVLDRIIQAKRRRVNQLKSAVSLAAFYDRSERAIADRPPNRLQDALLVTSRANIIAEFKRTSPSKGIINQDFSPVVAAVSYRDGGAAAISVLTEEDFFSGSLDDLQEVRRAVDLPILRKDFVVDEFQLYESALAGADAVLLIVAALEKGQLQSFLDLAGTLKLEVIVEVHNRDEMSIASDLGAPIIGVNNRDLKTFAVSLNVSRSLIEQKPERSLMIAESGLSRVEEVSELRELGYSAFLIGETLMRSGDPTDALRALTSISPNVKESSEPVASEGIL